MYFYFIFSLITAFLPIFLFHIVLVSLTSYCSNLSSKLSKKNVAISVDRLGRFWHDYKIIGLENIPEKGAALIVFYHGALPVDMILFKMRMHLNHRKIVYIVDRFLLNVPNFDTISKDLKLTTEGPDVCKQLLEKGEIIAVAPGGTYEALFGSENYELLWGDRLGFAKLALDCNVQIIPAFTQNTREAYRQMKSFRSLWMLLYKKFRIPFIPIFGGFPVRLTTFIGQPISVSKFKTPEKLKKVVISELDKLIRNNQKIPGSISKAVLERWSG